MAVVRHRVQGPVRGEDQRRRFLLLWETGQTYTSISARIEQETGDRIAPETLRTWRLQMKLPPRVKHRNPANRPSGWTHRWCECGALVGRDEKTGAPNPCAACGQPWEGPVA